LIGGFIVGGDTGCSKVVVRALGPSLALLGVGNALLDPALELHDSNGAIVAANDSWQEAQSIDLQAANLAPSDPREAAIMDWLTPGSYTAIVRSSTSQTGVGLVESYVVQ
jgi:hypothetical protein